MEPSHSTKSNTETAILIESKSKGKSAAAPAAFTATSKATSRQQGGWKRGVAIFDFILRLCALIAALAATIAMGTTDQTLPFFTQFFQFQASYDDLPAFTYASLICSSKARKSCFCLLIDFTRTIKTISYIMV